MVLFVRDPYLAPDSDQPIDITIQLARDRLDADLQLKVSADIKEVKCKIRRSKERTIHRVSNEKMYVHAHGSNHNHGTDVCDRACDKTKEVVVELFEYRRKYGLKEKAQILSMKVLLQDDELYTEKTYTSEWTYMYHPHIFSNMLIACQVTSLEALLQ